jgi:hypothetical protein
MSLGFTLQGSPHSLPTHRAARTMRLCWIGLAFLYVGFQCDLP